MTNVLTRAEKRKYALAMRRVDYGVWGYPLSLFREITLTTREGDDNTSKRFVADVRRLVKWFRGLGYELEYCGVLEFTPGKGLLHWHALVRVKGGYFNLAGKVNEGEKNREEFKRRNRRALGDKWNEIHNAFVVKMAGVFTKKALGTYINKHMVKEYLGQGVIRNKFLVSSGWSRQGWQEMAKGFKEWWVNGKGLTWMDREGWSALNLVIRSWAEGKPSIVRTSWGELVVAEGKIERAVIYAFNEEGERSE